MTKKQIDGIILCEGETDQVLIGYYLGRIRGWKYKHMSNMPFPDEAIFWYVDPGDRVLGIWPAGGNDFFRQLSMIFEMELLEDRLKRLVIVTDNDDDTVESTRIKALFDRINDRISLCDYSDDFYRTASNRWSDMVFESSFNKHALVKMSYVLVPLSKHGALETFMLESLSENDESKKDVISRIHGFINSFSSGEYLIRRRERIKAELGMSVAVFTPDKVFTEMDELIMSVEWEKFDSTNKQFHILKEI